MWILSMLFSVIGSATNLFFSLRYPSISITPVIALLLVHPLGLLWDKLLKRDSDPEETFSDGFLKHETTSGTHSILSSMAGTASNGLADHADDNPSNLALRTRQAKTRESRGTRERLRLWLAQGKWNQKEHSCVYISSNVSFGFAFATDVGHFPLLFSPIRTEPVATGHCRTNSFLPPGPWHTLPNTSNPFDTNSRLHICRPYASLPSAAWWYDMAWDVDANSYVYNATQRGEQGCQRMEDI
jgi:hypothetical protein